MPKILPSDDQESYVSRCIPYVMKNEGLNKEQAAGKCFGLFRNHKKNKKSKAERLLDAVADHLLKDGSSAKLCTVCGSVLQQDGKCLTCEENKKNA
jgi:recombinational DNA repair protein RecR